MWHTGNKHGHVRVSACRNNSIYLANATHKIKQKQIKSKKNRRSIKQHLLLIFVSDLYMYTYLYLCIYILRHMYMANSQFQFQ